MRPIVVIVLATLFAFGGTDRTGPQTLFVAPGRVVALAVRGNEVAWLRDTAKYYGEGCRLGLDFREFGQTHALQLPKRVANPSDCVSLVDVPGSDDALGVAVPMLALSGTAVGWMVDEEGGAAGEIDAGVSSTGRPYRTCLLDSVETWGGGDQPGTGHVFLGLAATPTAILRTIDHVTYRALEPGAECDLGAGGSCLTKVVAGGVVARGADGVAKRVGGLPPAGPLAAGDGLIALVTWPRGGWVHHEAPFGPTEVVDSHSRVIERVASPADLAAVAVSNRLLTLRDDRGRVAIYAVPSGRLLRVIRSPLETLVAGHMVVLWNQRKIVVLDPVSVRERTIVDLPATPANDIPREIVGAVTIDGDRIVWADETQLDGPALSVIRAEVVG